MSETKNELAERSLLAGSNVPPSSEDEQKRIRIDGLLNRKRKSTATDSTSQASTSSRLKEEEFGKEGKDEETREKKEKAKQKLLWEAKRGKERAERVGPQGWLRPQSLATNKNFLARTLRSTLPRAEK